MAENIKWKFKKKGSAVPRIEDVQNALIEAIDHDLIVWYDDVELPGIRQTMKPPRSQPPTPTLAKSAPTGLRLGRYLVETPSTQGSRVQSTPSQATKTQTAPSQVSKAETPKAVAPVSKGAEVKPSETTNPKQTVVKPPSPTEPATRTPVVESITVKDFKVQEITRMEPATSSPSQQTTLTNKAKAPESGPHHTLPKQPTQGEHLIHSASAKTPISLLPAESEARSKSASTPALKQDVDAEIDLLSFDDPDLLNFFAVMKPNAASQPAPPTLIAPILPLIPPPIPWASKPKPILKPIQQSPPQMVVQRADSQGLSDPTLGSPPIAMTVAELPNGKENASELPALEPQVPAEKAKDSDLGTKKSPSKPVQPRSQTYGSLANSRWAVKTGSWAQATRLDLLAKSLRNEEPSYEAPQLQRVRTLQLRNVG